MAFVELYRESGLIRRKWRWRRKSSNGRIIAASGEDFASKWNATRAARKVFPDDDIRVENT